MTVHEARNIALSSPVIKNIMDDLYSHIRQAAKKGEFSLTVNKSVCPYYAVDRLKENGFIINEVVCGFHISWKPLEPWETKNEKTKENG